MSEPVSSASLDQTSSTAPARQAKRRWVLAVVGAALLLTAYVLYWPRPQVALGVLTAQREADGRTVTEGEVSGKPALSGHATAVKANTTASTATTHSRSDGAVWMCDTLALFVDSEHLLLQRTGLKLFESLRDSGRYSQVRLVPFGKTLPEGEPTPDVFLVLQLRSLEESGLPGARHFKAKVGLRIGRDYAHGQTTYHTNLTPPVVQLQAEHEVDCDARQTGVETSGSQYSALSGELVKHLSKSVQDVLHKEASGSFPDRALIAEFFPAFQPAPEWPFLSRLKGQRLVHGCRMMQPTYAVWQLPATSDLDALQQEVTRDFGPDEWKFAPRDEAHPTLAGRWTRGTETLEIFAEPRSYGHGENLARPYLVVYERSLNVDDIRQALRALLERNPPETALLPFVSFWHLERDRLGDYFQKQPPRHVDGLRRLAEWKQAAGDLTAAKELLLMANALDHLVHHGERRSQLTTLAKKLELDPLPQEFDPAFVETLGLADLRAGASLDLIVRSGEPVLLWLAGTPTEHKFLKLTPVRRGDREWEMGHATTVIRKNSSSSGSGSPQRLDLDRADPIHIAHYEEPVAVTVKATDDPQTLTIHVKRLAR